MQDQEDGRNTNVREEEGKEEDINKKKNPLTALMMWQNYGKNQPQLPNLDRSPVAGSNQHQLSYRVFLLTIL